jgi:hypothetical protein
MKHVQHPDKTSETLETYFCNIRFGAHVTLLLGRITELDAAMAHGAR